MGDRSVVKIAADVQYFAWDQQVCRERFLINT